MPAVNFLKGDPHPVDYRPGSAVTAGSVVVIGQLTGVAHRNIAANELGALFVEAGIYEGTADGAIGEGVPVYWNSTTGKFSVTANAGANRHFGYPVPGSITTADGQKILVFHSPARAAI